MQSDGPVAQLVRAVPHNVLVPGSSPGGPPNFNKINVNCFKFFN